MRTLKSESRYASENSCKDKCGPTKYMIHDKKRREVILIEVDITSQDRLTAVETEQKRKYVLLGNKLSSEMKCMTKIIPYVMTCDGIVTTSINAMRKRLVHQTTSRHTCSRYFSRRRSKASPSTIDMDSTGMKRER